MEELEMINYRIIEDKEELARKLAYWEFKNKTFTFTYGYFDVIDKEKLEFLAQAADGVNRLLVGIYSDRMAEAAGVKLNHSERDRAQILASLRFVNIVIILDKPADEAVKELNPTKVVPNSKL